MSRIVNIYCDESCHLEYDGISVMGFGALGCLKSEVRRISDEIYALKKKHNAMGEIKWTKVSDSRLDFYRELISLFFNEDALAFRALLLDGKHQIRHDFFSAKNHHSAYYETYYSLLVNFFNDANECRIFIDIRDTWGSRRVKLLQDKLCEQRNDAEKKIIRRVQSVHSKEVVLMQVCDFLLGAITYANRKTPLPNQTAKSQCVALIEEKLGIKLTETNPPWLHKFNVLIFSLGKEGTVSGEATA